MSMIWLAGTRESEQPIHRYFGACCCDNCSKKCSSCARTRSDQARFFSISGVSFVMPLGFFLRSRDLTTQTTEKTKYLLHILLCPSLSFCVAQSRALCPSPCGFYPRSMQTF